MAILVGLEVKPLVPLDHLPHPSFAIDEKAL
jgi:hypothetical protein